MFPQSHIRRTALKHAFQVSIPIMAGYGFLGLTYGIYMHELGFSFLYPMLLAITVFAGCAEFLLGNILLGSPSTANISDGLEPKGAMTSLNFYQFPHTNDNELRYFISRKRPNGHSHP